MSPRKHRVNALVAKDVEFELNYLQKPVEQANEHSQSQRAQETVCCHKIQEAESHTDTKKRKKKKKTGKRRVLVPMTLEIECLLSSTAKCSPRYGS
jgi:hypothetical protein